MLHYQGRGDVHHHLVRSLGDLIAAAVLPDAAHARALGVAEAPQNLHGVRGHLHRGLGHVALHEGHVEPLGLVGGIDGPGRAVHHGAHVAQAHFHIGEKGLYLLEAPHLHAEGLAGARVGHRVVHGGEKFKASCLITDEVVNTIRELSPLAPLHNPAGILGIEAARKVFGNVPMVAVFDTAFHSTMPPKAYMYAIPYEYYEKYGVRRYGFHGTSHKYVAHKAAEYLEEPIERLKLITCHLGNGSSIAAVDQGKVVDTSMGMTPLAGLMMGTRCGDLDPSVVNYLKYTLNITGHELDEILNKKSGLLGISGVSSDKRDVEEAAAAGNKRAQLASDMLNYQIKKTVGAYIAAMGGVDAIVFTGGIGEHDAIARAKVCHHMDWLGIRIDTEKNKHPVGDVCEITAWGAKVRTLVIATDEELMIARDTKEVLEK